ncbi:MAG: cellulase family glycosylhydrolase [Planctomycetota bacterium]
MHRFSAFVLMSFLVLTAAHSVESELIANGSFESATEAGKPDGWKLPANISWESDGANHFVRLKSPQPGANVLLFRSITITPQIQALELSYKVRYVGIKRGKEKWFDGRIMLNFKDAAGSACSPSPAHPSFNGTSADWKDRSQQFKVPAGAATLELLFTLFNAESGQLDFDDISLHAIPVAIIDAAEAAAKEKEAARIAALPKPKPKVAAPPADKLPKELHVVGNVIQNSANETIWLQGLAIPSLEWSAGGDNILKSIEIGIIDWKSNCIRLPIREHFWAGTGPYQKDGGMQYRQTIDDAVNACASHGVYIVLDLHCFRAPKEIHAAFWKDLATRYKNHPAVLFELFNEPHDLSWDVWQNGGTVVDKKKSTPKPGDVLAENKETLTTFETIGIQKLIDAIRETGAKNIVIPGGLDWSYDLSGILDGHALNDRNGNGIVYSSHVYPWKSDWQNKFVKAAGKYPLFLGEVGAEVEKLSFAPPERQEDPYTWVPDMLGLIQKHKLNWTAWCFHPKSSPRVLKDWDYTPTAYWGEFVKQALAGKSFELKKLR